MKVLAACENPETSSGRKSPDGVNLVVWVLVCLSFLAYGSIAAPIPGVNEPHYLCKARHFWQPDWCANDFFLQSSNAHTVFFATVGALTQWLSLHQAAVIGRVLAALVLSAGWCVLFSQFARCRWTPLHICWMFLALQSCGNFSGEWLVGGIEGKVFCYAFLMAALGFVIQGQTVLGGAMAGMAVAFHPVVGVWGILAFTGAVFVDVLKQGVAGFHRATDSPSFKLRSVLAAFTMMLVFSLPGLIPVLMLISESVPEGIRFAANYIQVYYRLAHHLDPMQFPRRAYACYAGLIILWIIGMAVVSRSQPKRVFDRIVGFSILFALTGILIAWGPRPAEGMPYFAMRAALLKFYPFRLADILVPMAVAISVVSWLNSRGNRFVCITGFGVVFVAALVRAHSIVEVNLYSGPVRSEWIDACRWIDKNLPAKAVVQSPPNGWAFKWFAQRAEYVSFKDCPQDAKGVVEWNERLSFLKAWYEEHYVDKFYSLDELRELHRETGITHVLTDRLGPFELQPVFRNAAFQVYELPPL